MPAIAELAPTADPRPFLAPPWQDHGVIQRDRPIPVWGWDVPGTTVTVALAGLRGSAVAGVDGRWEVVLSPLAAGGPHRLEVVGSQRVVREDLLVGVVWLCSGQSNMEMGVGACADAAAEIAGSDLPTLRLGRVRNRTSLEPARDVDCTWAVCTPDEVQKHGWAGFSAVALAFGKVLLKELGVPVGLMQVAWGGSRIEAWLPLETLEGLAGTPAADSAAEAAAVRNALPELRAGRSDWPERMQAWWQANDLGGEGGRWWDPAMPDGDWGTTAVPCDWLKAEPALPDCRGVIWVRRSVEIPADWAGHGATLRLGSIGDTVEAFVGGQSVSQHNGSHLRAAFPLAADLLRPGTVSIALRLVHPWGVGLWGTAEDYVLERDDGATISLAGTWRYRLSRSGDGMPDHPRFVPTWFNAPATLANALITPLAPYPIAGAIWYQGEGNVGQHLAYQPLLAALAADWRARFRDPALPFGVVQLAGWLPEGKEPTFSIWAHQREAQAAVVAADPRAFIATAADRGDPADIHPPRKIELGQRLARGALAVAHGKQVSWHGPRFGALTVAGPALSVAVQGQGLAWREEPIDPRSAPAFALAGADRVFHPAEAALDGGTLRITSAAVPAPVAVRYAWGDHPRLTLVDGDGLPALPWRSDSW